MSQSKFIHESAVYQILNEHGIKVPKYETNLEKLSFNEGEPVVIKGIAKDLWHKSDAGALHFINFNKDLIKNLDQKMRESLSSKYEWIETMVCSRANFQSVRGLPSEAYISIQRDDACGTVISFGVGGIYAEAWAQELKSNVLMWSPALSSPLEALEEIKNHWLGKVWLGELRQGEPLTDTKKLLNFLTGIWNVAKNIDKKNITLLEMNPVVIDEDGVPIALDGVGTYADSSPKFFAPSISLSSLLNPKTVAIAGVSEKEGSFGLRILKNLLQSKIDIKNIKVIKPNCELLLGVQCLPDIKKLVNNPVDMLILTLPAAVTVKTLIELCEQGGGAEIVYLVAGGIGDGADTTGLAAELQSVLNQRKTKGLWTPKIIGPNSLGIVLSTLKLSTLFIAPEKLPIVYHDKGNLAFISQSGAYFITRFSKEENLPIKYGFCIGNQMDLKVSDFLETIATDPEINVIGTYIEGFSTHEALKLARVAKNFTDNGRHIVLYKGGRSTEGMKAAAGHTGAMAGNYDLQKKILKKSGIFITENFQEFSSLLNFLSAYPETKKLTQLAVISNAGFETVSSADSIGSKLFKINDTMKCELENILKKHGLDGLVSASNPLDLTPMANQDAYIECAEKFAKSKDADAILFCAVPLTDKLETSDIEKMKLASEHLKSISIKYNKPILVVVDSGSIYNNYREAFKSVGLPTYSSIEDAFLAVNYKSPII